MVGKRRPLSDNAGSVGEPCTSGLHADKPHTMAAMRQPAGGSGMHNMLLGGEVMPFRDTLKSNKKSRRGGCNARLAYLSRGAPAMYARSIGNVHTT